jgi:hypothetical protein
MKVGPSQVGINENNLFPLEGQIIPYAADDKTLSGAAFSSPDRPYLGVTFVTLYRHAGIHPCFDFGHFHARLDNFVAATLYSAAGGQGKAPRASDRIPTPQDGKIPVEKGSDLESTLIKKPCLFKIIIDSNKNISQRNPKVWGRP